MNYTKNTGALCASRLICQARSLGSILFASRPPPEGRRKDFL